MVEQAETIKLTDVPGIVEALTGKRPQFTTVKKWVRIGHRGVKLRVAGPAHFRFTTREWVNDFMSQCGGKVESPHPVQVQSDESRKAKESLRRNFGFKNL